MPVANQPVQVSLSDVLQVRAGALEEEELWSVLCQSAEAVQDIFIRGRYESREYSGWACRVERKRISVA